MKDLGTSISKEYWCIPCIHILNYTS